MDIREFDSDFGFKVGDAVLFNGGYEGNIGKVCTGVLKGMYEVRGMRGITCVSGADLKRVDSLTAFAMQEIAAGSFNNLVSDDIE